MFIGTVGPDLGSATRLAPQSLGSMHSELVVGGILVVIPAGELVSPAFQTIYIICDYMITYIMLTKSSLCHRL